MKKSLLLPVFIALAFYSCGNNSGESSEINSETETITATEDHSETGELKQLNLKVLRAELGESAENDGQFKITIPQNDLSVVVDGFKIIPPMGLGSWVAFAPTSGKPMLMGDIVVTEKDLMPVQKEVINQGLTITAIHNHFVRNEPDVMYMHIGGMGTEKELADKVKKVLAKVQEVRGGDPAAAVAGKVENSLNTKMIDSILGHTGSMNNGVYKLTIGRPDVNLTEHGAPVSTFMGFNTWASWQGTPEKAAVAGDFTMLEDEVAPVIKALIENDIEVVALHNHMVHEEPRIFFLHYWGVGPAEKLAKGLKAALDQTGTNNN